MFIFDRLIHGSRQLEGACFALKHCAGAVFSGHPPRDLSTLILFAALDALSKCFSFPTRSDLSFTLLMDPKTAALINAIRERSKEDPLIGAKLGAKEVFQRLLEGMKDSKGVHIESLLTALGALAGYACQANLRAQALANGMPETAAFHIIATNDGKQFFFGDPLNNALAGSQYSVWGLVGGAAQQAGAKEFPDLNEVFQHTASVLGSEHFGVPRVPDKHKPADIPLNYLKAMWPALLPTVKLFCPNPVDWPILYSLAIQDAIYAGKDSIDPGMAFRIVIESAIPMSKVDLENYKHGAQGWIAPR